MNVFRLPLILMACATLILDCGEAGKESLIKPLQMAWWEPLKPDVIIDNDEFYAGSCSITRVINNGGIKTARVIFIVPDDYFTSCSDIGLRYDGKYIILNVCEIRFGAGGCSGGRYRSADFVLWEEYIGVTWINSEEYEAWRKVGSTSSKADSVKKVIRE